MAMFDVIIIGAGPAGTAAAYDLLCAGLKVLMLDKSKFPRKKACAGGLTPKALDLYRFDISRLIRRRIREVAVINRSGKQFVIHEKKPLCYMTRREELDYFVLQRVMQKGAAFRVVPRIDTIDSDRKSVKVLAGKELFKARYLIGADGANSRVRQLTSPSHPFARQMAIEVDVQVRHPAKCKMTFDFSRSQYAYYWIFPRDDHVNIGVYSVKKNIRLSERLLVEYANKALGCTQLKGFRGYPICTGGFRYIPSGRVLLVGDAAGFAEPLLGEGIYFALKSGQLAAGSVIQGMTNSGISVGKRYQNMLKYLRMDLKLYQLSAKLLYRIPQLSLSLLSIPAFHRRFSKGYADGKSLGRIVF